MREQHSLSASDLIVHAAGLRGLALRLVRNPADAEDLVQETFVRGLGALSRGRDEPANLRAWLVTILKNLHLDACRQRQRRPREDSLDAGPEPAAPVAEDPPAWARVSPDEVQRALATLPAELRDAYVLRVSSGLSYDDIAARLGVPRATVGTRILRARRQLRALLEERHD